MEIKVVTREYKLVGISGTGKFPESFPDTASNVIHKFGELRRKIENARNYDTVFCPGMCNGIVATYFACLEVDEIMNEVPNEMISFDLPKTEYVLIRCTNNSIMDGYDKLSKWMNENKYKHKLYRACQIEIYYNFDSNGEEPADVLIPIERI